MQWLAPLSSEAPELIVATIFAWRLHAADGLGEGRHLGRGGIALRACHRDRPQLAGLHQRQRQALLQILGGEDAGLLVGVALFAGGVAVLA